MGITMQRKFKFVRHNKSYEKLIDYYFWALEDLNKKLPFICERSQKNIGCIDGNGESYTGNANRGESGDLCQPWSSPNLSQILHSNQIQNLGDLTNNNFCR